MGYISVTTFESLYLDKPTIIFCNIEDFFFKKKHLFFFKMLVDAKIIHKNSYEAANFINKNYSNIENWWQSDKVRKVIKIFKEKYCVDNCRFADSLIQNLS
jgi:putative transferase (TIGR04331 family)